jgi:hypothetical protein
LLTKRSLGATARRTGAPSMATSDAKTSLSIARRCFPALSAATSREAASNGAYNCRTQVMNPITASARRIHARNDGGAARARAKVVDDDDGGHAVAPRASMSDAIASQPNGPKRVRECRNAERIEQRSVIVERAAEHARAAARIHWCRSGRGGGARR